MNAHGLQPTKVISSQKNGLRTPTDASIQDPVCTEKSNCDLHLVIFQNVVICLKDLRYQYNCHSVSLHNAFFFQQITMSISQTPLSNTVKQHSNVVLWVNIGIQNIYFSKSVQTLHQEV